MHRIPLHCANIPGYALISDHQLMCKQSSMSDMMERNSLSMAQSLASQVEMLCLQAQNVSPFVEPIGRLSVAQGQVSIIHI